MKEQIWVKTMDNRLHTKFKINKIITSLDLYYWWKSLDIAVILRDDTMDNELMLYDQKNNVQNIIVGYKVLKLLILNQLMIINKPFRFEDEKNYELKR